MKPRTKERDELVSKIHTQRFKVMQHYLFLYGDRLKGKPCLYDKYNEQKLSGSLDEACYNALVITQQEELKLEVLLEQLQLLTEDIATH